MIAHQTETQIVRGTIAAETTWEPLLPSNFLNVSVKFHNFVLYITHFSVFYIIRSQTQEPESDSGDLKNFWDRDPGSKGRAMGMVTVGSRSCQSFCFSRSTCSQTSSRKSYSWIDSSAFSLTLSKRHHWSIVLNHIDSRSDQKSNSPKI